MDIDLIQATRILRRGGTVHVDTRTGGRLLVVRGCLWLTRSGDPLDYVLSAGESFALDYSESLIATALEDSAYSLLNVQADGLSSISENGTPSHIDRYRLRAETMRSHYIAESIGRILDAGVALTGAALRWVARRAGSRSGRATGVPRTTERVSDRMSCADGLIDGSPHAPRL